MKKDNKINVVILGSTGTIGVNALEVLKRSKKHKVFGLSAGDNIELFKEQLKYFKPDYAVIKNERNRLLLEKEFKDITFFDSSEGLVKLVNFEEVDLVVSAIVGFAGLLPTYHALKKGKIVALANKESLVAGGFLFDREEIRRIIPVDSEHSAIFQILKGRETSFVRRIILTASGGPFREYSQEDIKSITKEDALNHPNWSMGDKITIDSSTMINKALEIIEAHYLFNLPYEKISVVIHPQSVVHSIVEFNDSSLLAQMAYPDMKIPISEALYYPLGEIFTYKRVDFSKLLNLSFMPPDLKKFPGLKFAKTVIENNEMGVVLNQANERAVDAFLKDKIKWMDIFNVIDYVMNNFKVNKIENIKELEMTNLKVKEYTDKVIKSGIFK